ncbi:uncharacterized protein LOC128228853 [Mya arenaria]|uniref:uncharacterized protein LOC128228853 n=1 Tax=Mya arenaria TaxID=6604 RepID=UPI0022E87368|nr:uncharacterized protein LOC128228853 [Mya arenaria]XP_052796350.1 uncharacterized protein LOC128228853 [Mya arenaria]XP_052796358.1 uncharacterized protein LOC128228853 [Mya arenaria]XP_052796365.1 uncharacterized protein LOC128228853 [Mya arenaria]
MYAAIFDKPEGENWLKQWRAVFITRKALLPTVSTEATNFHGYLSQRAQIQSISPCTICISRDVQFKVATCPFHMCFRDELVNEHAYGFRDGPRALTLKNTKAENWANSPWEIAKVFMPPSGYQNKTTIEETDFNGIAGFIINCKRFHGNITDSFCEKAREAVNNIRHMPDMCTSVLTDQATTECIDNLYALLNEPGLQNRPEVVLARNDLDKLRTADLSKDENAYKYICHELHDEFQQRLDDIEMKLQSKEFDTQTAKDSIHTEGDKIQKNLELLWEGLNLFSDNISKTKNDILLSINEGRQRAMDRIAFLEKRATENIEQSVTDGKTTIETHAAEEKRKATEHIEQFVADGKKTIDIYVREQKIKKTEHIEQSVTEGKRTLEAHVKEESRRATEHIEQSVEKGQRVLEDQKEVLLQQLRKEEDENLQQRKLDLQKQLLNHYQTTAAVRIYVRLDIDAAVKDIYEKPKLKWKTKKDKDGQIREEDISKIDQIFLSDNDILAKTIFVEGEPGTGKTSLCKKIVDDWCKLKEDETGETKEDSLLSQFAFLFYIRLREVEDRCYIKDMILQCLIEQINSDYKESKELLAAILKSEFCLLLLDGLDEWKHGSCKRDERIPHVETGWLNCTTLITTRPYKLAEVKVTRLKLGNHVQMQGVQSPRKLVQRIILELQKNELKKRPNTCVKNLKKKGLWHFKGIPIVLVHVVWLWFRNKLKANMSQSEVYREIIEERWCEMNDKMNIEDNDIPKEFLDSLSELAFSTLLSANKDDSIVFAIKEYQLKKEYQRKSLESGIMSCSKKIGERSPSYQFLHKTLQEYLAALFLANCGSDLFEHCQHVQELYKHNMEEGVLNLTQMFLFLCGLNISAAGVFSKTLNEIFTEYIERTGYSPEKASSFQAMLLKGYEEAEKNEHTGMELIQQHIVIRKRYDLVYQDNDKNDYCYDNDDDDDYDDYDDVDDYYHDYVDFYLDDDKDDDDIEFDYNDEHKASFKKRMTDCFGKNKSNIVSLKITVPDLPSVLMYKKDPSILDLETCINLKFLHLEKVQCEDINLPNLNGLLECKINFSHNVSPVKLITSLRSSNLTCLKHLTLEPVDLQCKAEDIFCKLQHVEHIRVAGSSLSNNSQLDLGHLKHLKTLFLRGLAFSDVVNPHVLNLHKLDVRFRTHQRAPQLITALLAQSDDSIGYNMDWPLSNLTSVSLDNIVMSAGLFTRLVSMVIQTRHSVDCTLTDCTIEFEEDVRQMEVEMENQPGIQKVDPLPAPPDYTTNIILDNIIMSAGMFRRLVSMVIQARHYVDCTLYECTILSEEDVRDIMAETENQPDLQKVDPLPAPPDYTTNITLTKTPMSAGLFRLLISMVIQARHSVDCTLDECTILSEEDVRDIMAETENLPNLQKVDPLPAPPDYTTNITLTKTPMSAGLFRLLVSMVIQARHSVDCTLDECTILSEEDVRDIMAETENQPDLQKVDPLPAPPDYTTNITLTKTPMSAGLFRLLVSMVIQARHSVDCTLDKCTIEEDMRQMEAEMEKQPALQMVAPLPLSPDYSIHITLDNMIMSAGMLRRLVITVIQARHSVNCTLNECAILSEEDVRDIMAETEKQPALQMVAPLPSSPDYSIHITLDNMIISAGMFRRLVITVIQARHSVNCTLNECAILSEEDVRDIMAETEKQPTLQMVESLPASPNYTTYIEIQKSYISAETLVSLVSMVIQATHSVNCTLNDCTIESEEDIRQMTAETEKQPALQMVNPLSASSDYTTDITLTRMKVSAGMLRRLVSMVIQARHSVDCTLDKCTIEEDMRQMEAEMEKQPALQMVAPLPSSPDYSIHITLDNMIISAGMFRRLVITVIQARHSVNCTLNECAILSEEDVRDIMAETEKQPTLQMVESLPASPNYTTYIEIQKSYISAETLVSLVSMVIQATHSVNCTLNDCTIESEEDIRQMTAETEKQPALQMVNPLSASSDYTTDITLTRMKVSAGMLRRLVSMVIQARHSVNCTLFESTIEEDIRQMKAEMENQPLLKVREFNEKTSLGGSKAWFIKFTINI